MPLVKRALLNQRQAGSTLMEVMVTAAIVAVVLMATVGVLMRYTETDVRSNKTLRALHMAQAELDMVLAHHAVENSLASDTRGRARYYAIESLGFPVSEYFHHNFPVNLTHEAAGSLDSSALVTLFAANEPRSAAGAPAPLDESAFLLRYQLLGVDQRLQSHELDRYLNATATPSIGFYQDDYFDPAVAGGVTTRSTTNATTVWNPLIGDSSPSFTIAGKWANGMRRETATYRGYQSFVSKVLIVRVYDRQDPGRSLGQAYEIVNGRIQL